MKMHLKMSSVELRPHCLGGGGWVNSVETSVRLMLFRFADITHDAGVRLPAFTKPFSRYGEYMSMTAENNPYIINSYWDYNQSVLAKGTPEEVF